MKCSRQDWLPYFRVVADKMRLKDWEIQILDELPKEGALASVYCVHGRKLAVLRLAESFRADTETSQRYAVVHELTHCHFALADAIATQEIDEKHIESYNLASEYGIDGMASATAPFMPLPSEVISP